jgi:hypothetical protein
MTLVTKRSEHRHWRQPAGSSEDSETISEPGREPPRPLPVGHRAVTGKPRPAAGGRAVIIRVNIISDDSDGDHDGRASQSLERRKTTARRHHGHVVNLKLDGARAAGSESARAGRLGPGLQVYY